METDSTRVALVVDDSGAQRACLAMLVKSLGFTTVLEACDGVDALRVLADHGNVAVYLVLTDLDMPRMDGIELIEQLRVRGLAMHVIATTAGDPRILDSVEGMGNSDSSLHLAGTVAKPVQREQLLTMLEQIDQTTGIHVNPPAGLTFDLAELWTGLALGQFIPFYQPKISLTSGQLTGLEALVRWRHPVHGLMAPARFLSLIEGTALMAPLTLALVEQVLCQKLAWQAKGMTSLSLAINLAADTLADTGFVDQLVELVRTHRVAPGSLVWEVTETMVLENPQCLSNLARLRLKGFGLAMDDYGIGYSSMRQLSRCPFTELKIDRSFVHCAASRPSLRSILDSSIKMGHGLNTTTVGEGVETLCDWALLQRLGCDSAQGYLIAKPMAADAVPGWIQANEGRLRKMSEHECQLPAIA